jgi:sugar phosphate permease
MTETLVANNEIEKRTVKKVFWRIVPFLFLLFMCAFVDRINISFAALAMNKDLGFSNAVYGLGAGIFFLGFFMMEIPGILIMTKVGARFWIARILITWGIISGLTAFVTTDTQFYVVRFLLGVAEASFSPCIGYYLALWFLNKDYAQTFAIFLAAMPACSVIAAPISAHIMEITWFGWVGWKWLFILEAIPSVALGFMAYYYLTDHPKNAKWLTDDEKFWLVNAMAEQTARINKKKSYTVMQALMERNVWIMTLGYFFWMSGMYGVTLFMPTLIKAIQANFSNITVGYLVSIPFIFGLMAMILIGRHSDATSERQYHVAGCMAVSALALVASVYLADVNVVLTIICFSACVCGYLGAFGPFWAMPPAFMTAASMGAGIALINSVGNLGGFAGPYLLGYIRTVTGSFEGGILCLAGGFVICAVVMVLLKGCLDCNVQESNDKVAG